MPYDDLIQSVEASAGERITEIKERAQKEADEILREARTKENAIKAARMEEAKRAVEIERTKLTSTARKEQKIRVNQIKDAQFQRAFQLAQQQLATVRSHSSYRKTFTMLLKEALEEMEGKETTIHVDPRDESLCRIILGEGHINSQISTDLRSNGGVAIYSLDENFRLENTFESRLKKGREQLRSDIFSLLFGD